MKKFILTSLSIVLLVFILINSCKKPEDDTPQPTACFNASTTQATVGETITFTNCSQNAESYSWQFGDGNQSTEVNPTHSYSITGSFVVNLRVANGDKNDQTTVTITVTAAGPTACFTPSTTTASIGESIIFTNCSQNATSYSWAFGDGATSTATSPSHSYSSAGTYNVTLTASDGSNTDQTSRSITITGPAFDFASIDGIPDTYYQDYFYDEFDDNSNNWYEGELPGEYDLYIEYSTYYFTNYSNGPYTVTNNNINLDEDRNYEIWVGMVITQAAQDYGSGFVWGKSSESFNFYYFKIDDPNWYVYGDMEEGNYIDWTTSSCVEPLNEYNDLTLRKVNDTYYYFINDCYMGSEPIGEFFGTGLGFYCDYLSTIEIDYIDIMYINLTKSGNTTDKKELKIIRESQINKQNITNINKKVLSKLK
ncbi:MAG: PKD domain-containing protein [Bacteroidales bacterium]|nr:PKD domain-containing protein [Bacteroidales bacterium]